MTSLEKPDFTPEQVYEIYLDGLKNDRGRVRNFDFILFLKTDAFGDFLENLKDVLTYTDYAGFHLTDPNWYEEGNYRTGILHPKLYEELENHFREEMDIVDRKILDNDQVLTPICHYSNQPGPGRANLLIEVSGGERSDWGQFILCWLEEYPSQIEFQENPQTLNEMRRLALRNRTSRNKL